MWHGQEGLRQTGQGLADSAPFPPGQATGHHGQTLGAPALRQPGLPVPKQRLRQVGQGAADIPSRGFGKTMGQHGQMLGKAGRRCQWWHAGESGGQLCQCLADGRTLRLRQPIGHDGHVADAPAARRLQLPTADAPRQMDQSGLDVRTCALGKAIGHHGQMLDIP